MSISSPILRLLRPHQWVKSAFVLLGPLYGLRDMQGRPWQDVLMQGFFAAAAFAAASSACYIYNDLRDAAQDRAHPRKKFRPIAAGQVQPGTAWTLIAVMLAVSAVFVGLVRPEARPALGLMVGLYVLNVLAYSTLLKRVAMADVVCLAMGFVLRVIGGCVAVGISPTTWLLNCTLFLAMFLAFGKRLGERRTAEAGGFDASTVRGVQAKYTDNLLRMAVVVTAVAALITYAGYVQSREGEFAFQWLFMPKGFNWLWLTIVPATFGLLRSVSLLERGVYDDPTEMIVRDRGMLVAVAGFVGASAMVISLRMTHAV